jgi:hypothetical protein
MLERGSQRLPDVVTSLWLLASPRAACECMQQGCSSPTPPRPLSLWPPRLCQPGDLWFLLGPASARYPLWGAVKDVAGTPRARRYGRWTDDRGVGELALGPDFEPHHGRTFGHHHEGGRLLRLFLVPPRQRAPRRLHLETQRPLPQAPEEQRQP